MSHPRQILPGETYLVTRRCSQRAFRLRPSAVTNDIFLYCLAFAAKRAGVQVHAACVMSNHHHLIVTDTRGVLPIFLRELHRLTAKAMNASQGRWENLWAGEPCNVVRLVTDEDIAEKIAYVAANPVAAGLVKQPLDWPGVLAWGERVVQVVRPRCYFKDDGVCPLKLTLRFEWPPARGDGAIAPADWRERVRAHLVAKVAAAHAKMVDKGHVFLGRAAVLASSFTRQAKSFEVRFGIVPTLAASLQSVRDHLRRVQRFFRSSYRKALNQWRSGTRDALFPLGTWKMRVEDGARVETDTS